MLWYRMAQKPLYKYRCGKNATLNTQVWNKLLLTLDGSDAVDAGQDSLHVVIHLLEFRLLGQHLGLENISSCR